MPELKIASSMRICSGFGFHLGFGSGLRSSHPGTVKSKNIDIALDTLTLQGEENPWNPPPSLL